MKLFRRSDPPAKPKSDPLLERHPDATICPDCGYKTWLCHNCYEPRCTCPGRRSHLTDDRKWLCFGAEYYANERHIAALEAQLGLVQWHKPDEDSRIKDIFQKQEEGLSL